MPCFTLVTCPHGFCRQRVRRMGEEAEVMRFLRRRTKDLTMTPGFWNFLITLTTIVALIFYFGGAPNTKNFRQREKVTVPNVQLS